MRSVVKIISLIGDLKPISPITAEIIGMADQPDVGTSDIAAIVGRDPALAANLLKRVNSAHFGLKRKVDTLQSAIVILGTRQTIMMVLASAMAPNYADKSFDGYCLGNNELWEAAVISSEIARTIALKRDHPQVNRIFTAALVRDIGKIVLNQFVAEKATIIRKIVESEKIGYIEAENRILQIDHTQLGGLAARRWSFPKSIVHIIEHHHDETLTVEDDEETAIVQAADSICSMLGVGTGNDGMRYKLSPSVVERLMPNDQVEKIIAGILAGKDKLLGMMMDR
jgi:HD-like signal output (HDOD) protein